jgi:hypothetical protein
MSCRRRRAGNAPRTIHLGRSRLFPLAHLCGSGGEGGPVETGFEDHPWDSDLTNLGCTPPDSLMSHAVFSYSFATAGDGSRVFD